MRRAMSFSLWCALAGGVSSLQAAVVPYTTDANTAALYSFNETSGASDPGNPFVNAAGNAALNLTNTGGPDGRDNSAGGGYGATAYSAPFGTAFNALAAGDNTYHSGTSGSGTGGGATTAGNVLQSLLQGANGAFTLEALVRVADSTTQQTILSHDSLGTRGFLFRIDTGNINLFSGQLVGGSTATLTATIPTTGPNAFVANEWFHVAITYNGAEATADNLTFYWTRLNESVTAANPIGTGMLSNDMDPAVNNMVGAGTITRSPFRFEVNGLVDEARISTVARSADQFVFAVPEPSLLVLGGVSLLGLGILRRRRA